MSFGVVAGLGKAKSLINNFRSLTGGGDATKAGTNISAANRGSPFNSTTAGQQALPQNPFLGNDNNGHYRVAFVLHDAAYNGSKPPFIRGWLPDTVSVDTSASYAPIFGNDSVFSGVSDIAAKALTAAGYSGITQEMTYQTWTSSQNISMSLPITFVAQSAASGGEDADITVTDQILFLQRLTLPSKTPTNTFLVPPLASLSTNVGLQNFGAAVKAAVTDVSTAVSQNVTMNDPQSWLNAVPAIGHGLNDGLSQLIHIDRYVSVYIGEFLYFEKCVIKSVSSAYDTRFHRAPDGRIYPIQATANISFEPIMNPTRQDLNKIYRRTETK